MEQTLFWKPGNEKEGTFKYFLDKFKNVISDPGMILKEKEVRLALESLDLSKLSSVHLQFLDAPIGDEEICTTGAS